MFKGHAEATTKMFGGKGGDKTKFIDIDYPNEFLTGISGTVGHYGHENVVASLEIVTNRCKYGPFGKQVGTPFSFHAENGVIIGFHGRADSYMNAIGVYLRKVSMKKDSESNKVAVKKELEDIEFPIPLPRLRGARGNMDGGRRWDDGIFFKVKEVYVHLCVDKGIEIICGVRFLYERKGGFDVVSPLHGSSQGTEFMGNEYRSSGAAEISVRSWGGQFGNPWNWRAESGITQISISHGEIIDSIVFKGHDEATSKRFGGNGGDKTDTIDIDYPYEFVTGISGTMGHFYDKGKVVTSLKINTNRCKYGHFGKESGTPFSFNAENGVIIGFHGRANTYMNVIGVYLRKIMLPMESDIAEIPLKQFDREYEIV
ncbi:Unknown protein [Striga hermonthica]|uniref:Jacalin-type lectin domain-containing protein n=1 Tax=Striga hermonthica TaxID=68872 RepID=A0A9N7MSY0_STRHE|nr:Unknown protein [Striga hermonthica]